MANISGLHFSLLMLLFGLGGGYTFWLVQCRGLYQVLCAIVLLREVRVSTGSLSYMLEHFDSKAGQARFQVWVREPQQESCFKRRSRTHTQYTALVSREHRNRGG